MSVAITKALELVRDAGSELPRPYYADELVTLYQGDCLELLPQLERRGRRPLVLTDPPYVFGLASTTMAGKGGGWADMMNAARFYAAVLAELERLVQRGGAAWVFNSWRSFPVLAKAAHLARWPVRSLMVWDKECIGPGSRGLRPSYELCALFTGDGFGLNNRGLSDIWRASWPSAGRTTEHPSEKPVALLRRMIAESEADVVIDPFCGSGSALVAARSLGVPSIGIEESERWCRVAAGRVAALPLHDPQTGQRALFDVAEPS